MRKTRIWAAMAVVLMGGSCASPPQGAGLLWLPPGAATDRGAQDYKDGSSDLPFTLGNVQPEEFSTQLAAHFAGRGWHSRVPRLDVYPPSTSTGWRPFPGGGLILTDAHGQPLPPYESLQWHGEWEDEHGNVISYHLTASRPVGAVSYSILGYGTYAPRSRADVVEMRQRQ